MVENDKDKQLHMVQKYSSGEIYHELLCLNTKQEQNYETIILSSSIYLR